MTGIRGQHHRNLHSISAVCSEVRRVPENKGLYFFFLREDCNINHSEIFNLGQIEHAYTRNVNGEDYHLVYIGSAGTGKSKGASLRSRLKWHLCQHHNNGSVCYETLSTLRIGLSALLSDDIIIEETENKVNRLFQDCARVYYISYDSVSFPINRSTEK